MLEHPPCLCAGATSKPPLRTARMCYGPLPTPPGPASEFQPLSCPSVRESDAARCVPLRRLPVRTHAKTKGRRQCMPWFHTWNSGCSISSTARAATDAGAFLSARERPALITSKGANAMYTTKHDLPAMTRADVIVILNARLADSIDLMHQAKQAHWNVKGPSFMALHTLFDAVVDAAEDYMDLLAERVVQLGGTAEGTIQVATTRTGLEAYPLTLLEERDHVEALTSALAIYGRSVRRAIEQTDELGDKDTADICTEISRGVDKYLWFVEAHLGSPAGATRRRP